MNLTSLLSLPMLFKRFVLVGLVLAGSAASAASIAGVNFEDRIRLADTDLVLNGTGLRAVLMFKGYAAGLYLTKKVRTPEQVLATPGAKRVQMKMLLDVEAKEFVKAIDVGIKRNSTDAQQAALKDRMAQFDRNVAQIGTVKKGDVVNLDFVPARGLTASRAVSRLPVTTCTLAC